MTINKLIEILREIADNHYQINSFGFGSPAKLPDRENTLYPVMWCDTKPSTIVGKDFRLSLEIAVYDLLINDESNIDEVLSDTNLIALDIIAQLSDSDYSDYFTLDRNSIQLSDFKARFRDYVAGWVVTLTLVIPFLYDRCQIPASEIPPISKVCKDVTVLDQDGNVVATVEAGGIYNVIVFSGIIDEGEPYENSIIDNS